MCSIFPFLLTPQQYKPLSAACWGYSLIFIYLLYFNQLLPAWLWYASCHEMNKSRKLVKLNDMKKEIFPFILLSCGLGHRQISALQSFIRLWYLTTIASCQCQGFIAQAMPHAFPLTNPHHTFLSCTILLACLASKLFFFKQSFTVSIHLFRSLPTEQLPANFPT